MSMKLIKAEPDNVIFEINEDEDDSDEIFLKIKLDHS